MNPEVKEVPCGEHGAPWTDEIHEEDISFAREEEK